MPENETITTARTQNPPAQQIAAASTTSDTIATSHAAGGHPSFSASNLLSVQVVTRIDDAICSEVQQYIARSETATGVCGEHDPRWLRVLQQSMKHDPYLLIVRDSDPVVDVPQSSGQHAGPIRGILPLALVASHLFGRFLVGLPYLNRAGIAADHAEAANLLINHAVKLSEQLNVQYLELRHHDFVHAHDKLSQTIDDKVRMVLPLPCDTEFLWKTIHSKVRNQVRKGGKQGFELTWGGHDQLDAFYNVFCINMRDLGTPVFPKALFANMLEAFTDEAELAVVRYQGEPIAAAMLIHDDLPATDDRRITQVPSASCLRSHNKSNANMWMYYHLLQRAIERGSTSFDFGRSSIESGTFRFKKQWGAQPMPTAWQYHVRHGEVGEVRPDNPKYQRRIELWQKLPVWVTRLIGPRIVRGIP